MRRQLSMQRYVKTERRVYTVRQTWRRIIWGGDRRKGRQVFRYFEFCVCMKKIKYWNTKLIWIEMDFLFDFNNNNFGLQQKEFRFDGTIRPDNASICPTSNCTESVPMAAYRNQYCWSDADRCWCRMLRRSSANHIIYLIFKLFKIFGKRCDYLGVIEFAVQFIQIVSQMPYTAVGIVPGVCAVAGGVQRT